MGADVCLLITYRQSLPKEGLCLCVLQEKNENQIDYHIKPYMIQHEDPIEIIYHSLAFTFPDT